jgi:hypothetical protein
VDLSTVFSIHQPTKVIGVAGQDRGTLATQGHRHDDGIDRIGHPGETKELPRTTGRADRSRLEPIDRVEDPIHGRSRTTPAVDLCHDRRRDDDQTSLTPRPHQGGSSGHIASLEGEDGSGIEDEAGLRASLV